MLLDNKTLEIMKYFLRDLNKLNHGSEIARKLKMNQKTVSSILNKLENKGILKSTMAGKTKQFKFNFDELAEDYINFIENAKTLDFLKKNPKIVEIIKKLNFKGIVVIFGSYAKGLQKPDSDLDLFIVGEYESIKKISELYGININIKKYKRNEFIRALKRKSILINEIIKDHIIVKGKDLFVKLIIEHYYGKY